MKREMEGDADIKRETERWMEICTTEIRSEIGSRRVQREIKRETREIRSWRVEREIERET